MRRLALGLGALVFVIFTAAVAHRVTDIVRGSPVRAVEVFPAGAGAVPPASSPAFTRQAGALSGALLTPGNRVRVLTDAETFDVMLRDLAGARRSISLLSYFCQPGKLADRFIEVLGERARAGVDVRVLGDGFGCGSLLPRLESELLPLGARVETVRPLRWWTMHRAQHRHHGRIVVVDGEVAHTGGFGVADAWISGEANEPTWRDTNVRVEGPVVASMEGAFAAAWVEATGHLLAFAPHPDGDLAPSREEVAPDGAEADAWAGLLLSGPGIGSSPAERYLALSLVGARKTLYLANPYFVPPPGLRALLLGAAARGVDVRLLVPGRRTDVPSTRWAGRGYYSDLLDAGVRIWEYQPAMMHAKTLVADGSWVGIGSLNFDNRSLRLNDETVLLIQDARVGAHLDSLFLADLLEAKEILSSEHASRPIGQRLLEFLTRLAAPML